MNAAERGKALAVACDLIEQAGNACPVCLKALRRASKRAMEHHSYYVDATLLNVSVWHATGPDTDLDRTDAHTLIDMQTGETLGARYPGTKKHLALLIERIFQLGDSESAQWLADAFYRNNMRDRAIDRIWDRHRYDMAVRWYCSKLWSRQAWSFRAWVPKDPSDPTLGEYPKPITGRFA